MKPIFFSAVFLLMVCCNKKQDTYLSCEQQREKAKNDFKNNKLIYFDYLQSEKDFDRQLYADLLKENNIILDTLIPEGCIPLSQTDLNHEYCYKIMMNNNLSSKFGNHFFDSLRSEATIKNSHSGIK